MRRRTGPGKTNYKLCYNTTQVVTKALNTYDITAEHLGSHDKERILKHAWFRINCIKVEWFPALNSVGQTYMTQSGIKDQLVTEMAPIYFMWESNPDKIITPNNIKLSHRSHPKLPTRYFKKFLRLKTPLSGLTMGKTQDVDIQMRSRPFISTSDLSAVWGRALYCAGDSVFETDTLYPSGTWRYSYYITCKGMASE